jgi:hypothetical protein
MSRIGLYKLRYYSKLNATFQNIFSIYSYNVHKKFFTKNRCVIWFIYDLLKDAVVSSDNIASNDMINELERI